MTFEELQKIVYDAGIVGAGGAGFPTHRKFSDKVKQIIVNAAECEPLMMVDHHILEHHLQALVDTLNVLIDTMGADEAIIGIKGKNMHLLDTKIVASLEGTKVRIKEIPDIYPAGDEVVLTYETTGKIIPEGAIPVMVGVMVINVETVYNIHCAITNGQPVTQKYVTIGGDVDEDITVKVPVGMKIKALLEATGHGDLDGKAVINGGPMMGRLVDLENDSVTKTTKGLLIFPETHSITAGTVDADRLDYCTRDAYCAGLLASKFNYERMVKAFVLKEKEDKGLPEEKLEIKTKKYLFCPMSKTADQIEDLLNRRWNIFTKMNFHHRVHKHEILLSEVIVDLGMKELDGEGTFEEELEVVLPLEISSIWRLIGELRTNRSLAYQIIQLDDSWIDTLLRNKFFERYGSSKYYNLSVYGNNPEWNRFEELISTKKRYHSLIKRSRDFRFLDEKFYDSMRSKILEMDASEEKHWDNFTLVKLSNSYLEFCKQTKSFCWNYCWDMIIGDIDDKKDIYSKAEIYLNSLKEEKDNCGVAHFLVRSCEFKTGYSVAKYPVNLTHMGKVFPLGQVSNIGDDLKNARNLLPLFHVFYLPQYDTSREEVIMCNINMIYEYLAEVLSKIVLDRLSEQPNPKKK